MYLLDSSLNLVCLNTSDNVSVFCFVFLVEVIPGIMLSYYSLSILYGSHSSFQFMEGLLCFDPPTLFLKIPSLCWPLHERNYGISCVWKHLHAHFPSMFGRHWAVASSVAVEKPMPVWCPVFHMWPVQSLETCRLLFIRGVLKFHNDTALWMVLFFSVPSIELDIW